MVKKALIVGGGIGGLTAATALAQQGVHVKLVEQAPALTEVGAGIQVSPNGLAVLRALGLEQDLDRAGAVQAKSVHLCDYENGASVAKLDLTRLHDQRYLFVHRADIVAILERAARKAGVDIALAQRAVRVIPGAESEVHFDDGEALHAELVVCADGLNSIGREPINGETTAQFTGQVAWRSVVPVDGPVEPRATVTMGPGRHIVCYPLRGSRYLNIVAVQERDIWAEEGWSHKDTAGNLRAAFADFGGPISAILNRVEDVYLWGLFRHPVAATWVKDGAVLLGDAAHPTVPFLAQGANMAIEDAWVLAQVVAQGRDLKLYQLNRQTRTQRIVETASRNAWKYHLHPGPLRWAAHHALSLGSQWAPGAMMKQFDWLYLYDVTKETF